jgi:hypothetical protein
MLQWIKTGQSYHVRRARRGLEASLKKLPLLFLGKVSDFI